MAFLEKKRKEIDKIDKKIINLLEKRLGIVKEIIFWKKQNKIFIEDLNREKEIKKKYSKSKLPLKFRESFFSLLFKTAKEEKFFK